MRKDQHTRARVVTDWIVALLALAFVLLIIAAGSGLLP